MTNVTKTSVGEFYLDKKKKNMKNVGNVDQGIRLVLAAVLAVLFLTGILTGAIGIISLVVAAILLLTGIFRFCPLYALLGLRTCPKVRE